MLENTRDETERDDWRVKGKLEWVKELQHQLLSEMVNEHRQTVTDKTKGCWSLGHKAD